MATKPTVRELNDQLRTTFDDQYGRILFTQSVMLKGAQFVIDVTEEVKKFAAFDASNDPYGEHDFGSFEFRGEKVLFKIDYYDTKYKYGSPDHADPDITRRVLTIMLAEDW